MQEATPVNKTGAVVKAVQTEYARAVYQWNTQEGTAVHGQDVHAVTGELHKEGQQVLQVKLCK